MALRMLIMTVVFLGRSVPMFAQACTPPPPGCPCYRPPEDPLLGEYFSSVDVEEVAKNEGGNQLTAYTLRPATWPHAGVTVAIGVDLGQQNQQGLKNLGVPQALIDRLSPYLGLKGPDAADALKAAPLILTIEEASQLNGAVLKGYFNAVGWKYDRESTKYNLSKLPWQAQTVLADLWYNIGDLATKAPSLWNQMISGDWTAAYDNLMDFTNKHDVLKNRAQSDAALLKLALEACRMPTMKMQAAFEQPGIELSPRGGSKQCGSAQVC